jgi:hypothetical protein
MGWSRFIAEIEDYICISFFSCGRAFWVPVTYRKLKQLFAWTRMKSDVHDFVQSFITCQQAKPDISKSPSLLQPLPVPEGAWQVISLDFVEGLPQSGHAN